MRRHLLISAAWLAVRLALVSGVVLAAPGCTLPRPYRNLDASADGGGPDSAADVGRDTGSDAPVPTDGWVPLAISPTDACSLDEADEVLLASTSFPVEPCPDRSGCRRIARTWTDDDPGRVSFHVYSESGGELDGRTLVLIDRIDRYFRYTWVIDDRGRALRGYRTLTMGCRIAAAVGDEVTAFSLDEWGYSDAYVFAADHGGPTRALFVRPAVRGPEVLVDQGWGALGSTSFVERFPLDGSIAGGPASEPGVYPTLAELHGSTVFFDVWDGNRQIDLMVAELDRPSRRFGDGVRSSESLTTDGTTMAWLEHDYDGPRTVLAADYGTTRPASATVLDVLDVASIPQMPGLRVGHGYVSYTEGNGAFTRVYRLADGYRAEIPLPAGELWYRASHIGPQEIAISTWGGVFWGRAEHLMFIRLDSLDWQPPP